MSDPVMSDPVESRPVENRSVTSGSIVSWSITLATARRVLNQLRRDPRTVAMLLVVPAALLSLLRWVLANQRGNFDHIGASVLGIFPFIVMFIVASVSTLRERTTGTLERLLTMPMHKLDLLLGYAMAFGAVAVTQVGVSVALALGPLGLHVRGPGWLLFVVGVLDALLGMALGLFLSAFATTEFQAVQFMPAIAFPQLLLCGLLTPRPSMDAALRAVSDVLPLTYAVDAMQHVTTSASLTRRIGIDVAVVATLVVAALVLGAATLRRRTP
jgi:ABC-2 type transport system permease protein